VKKAILDDHLLRDLLADDCSPSLTRLLHTHDPCTTNLYLYRLCKSVVSARGGQLTGQWTQAQRIALGSKLVTISTDIQIVPLQKLAIRMAEISDSHRVSTLGAEAVAAAENLSGTLVVWDGDNGPGIQTATKELRVSYRTLQR
jgi:hypothetical protein